MQTMKSWSYSRLTVFEKCPYQAKLKFVDKIPEPEGRDRTPLERGIMIHTAAEDYIQGRRDDIAPELKHFVETLEGLREEYLAGRVEVEGDWAYDIDWTPCDWFDENVWLRMKLDVRQVIDVNQSKVIDWKSGRKDGNEVSHSQQGLLYAIGEFMRYPEIQATKVLFAYTDKNQKMERDYTRDKALRFLPSWHDRAVRATTAVEFPAKPNKMNCRYCPYGPNNGGSNECPWGVDV